MISEIRLRNFQGFGEQVVIPLSPLTLIYGPNAAGKSSIFRALLLAKQSVPQEPYGMLRYSGFDGFIYEGEQISLASFANVVHKHDINATLNLGYTFELGADEKASSRNDLKKMFKSVSLDWEVTNSQSFTTLEIGFQAFSGNFFSVKFSRTNNKLKVLKVRNQDAAVEALRNYESRRKVRQSKQGVPGSQDSRTAENFGLETFSEDDFKGLRFPILGNLPRITIGNFADVEGMKFRKQTQIEVLDDLVLLARSAMMQNLSEVKHIKPLREIDHRFIYEGDGLIDDSNTLSDGEISSQRVVSDWISELTNKRYEFKTLNFVAEEMSYLGKMRSQMLIDTKTNTPVSFRDVGVGLSQVKPILEALSKANDVRNIGLLIEQPELHLHPKMQGEIASLFARFIKGNSTSQIIAETHSESMLLRIQKGLRDGLIDPNLIRILYVDESHNQDNPGNVVSLVDLEADKGFSFELPLSFSNLRFKDLI